MSSLSPVYPRECGGTDIPHYGGDAGFGLSPRVRGNQYSDGFPTSQIRSIPASAGEPSATAGEDQVALVYPRECGGTLF